MCQCNLSWKICSCSIPLKWLWHPFKPAQSLSGSHNIFHLHKFNRYIWILFSLDILDNHPQKKKKTKKLSNTIGIPPKHKYINYILYTFLLNADTYIHGHNIVNSTLSEEQAQTVLVNVFPVLVLNVIHWEDDRKTGQWLILSLH